LVWSPAGGAIIMAASRSVRLSVRRRRRSSARRRCRTAQATAL